MDTIAALTTLDQTESSQAGTVLGLYGQVMELKLLKDVKVGSPVKIEAGDTLSLGEVSYCRPDGDGYNVCVEVMQELHHVNELSCLAHALIEGRN